MLTAENINFLHYFVIITCLDFELDQSLLTIKHNKTAIGVKWLECMVPSIAGLMGRNRGHWLKL